MNSVLCSFENHTELPITEAHKILSTSWYNPNHSTVIFCHGFTGVPNGPAVKEIIKAYIKQGESNVALLNWDYLASALMSSLANSYVNWAAPNARQLAVRLVDTFLNLSDAGLDLNKTHLIGHSLGAHIWGITGNNLQQKGVLLPWITGLDPAALGFEIKPAAQRLNPYSAAFVDIIHTDPSKYGMKTSVGVVDFWPNYRNLGHMRQPGCPDRASPILSMEDLCSHNRSWRLWVDAIKYPGTIMGSYAKNYKIWKNYRESERNSITLKMGEYNLKARPGNYYFVTNSESPFGRSREGL
ncbi:unnamed protein product, partial [Brenthis ino]